MSKAIQYSSGPVLWRRVPDADRLPGSAGNDRCIRPRVCQSGRTAFSGVSILNRFRICFAILAAAALLPGADVHVVAPPGAVLAGPYSPGVMANDFLYVSGQGPVGRDGKVAADFDGQMRQALENVKSVVTAGGLTMEHVVYARSTSPTWRTMSE